MKKILMLLVLALTIFSSCQLVTDNNIIIYPTDGITLSADINIQLKKPDAITDLDYAELFLDNNLLVHIYGTDFDSGGYYDMPFSPSAYSEGVHTLTAIMIDQIYSEDQYSNTVTFHIVH